MGDQAIRMLILPNIKVYVELLEPLLRSEVEDVRRHEAQCCFYALLECLSTYTRNAIRSGFQPKDLDLAFVTETYGEAFLARIPLLQSELAPLFT